MLVGSYCRFTNKGGIVHPGASLADLEELSSLLQVGVQHDKDTRVISSFVDSSRCGHGQQR